MEAGRPTHRHSALPAPPAGTCDPPHATHLSEKLHFHTSHQVPSMSGCWWRVLTCAVPRLNERLNRGRRRRSQQARGGGGACAPLVHSSLLFLLVLSADNIIVIGAPAPCPPPACPMRAHQAHPRARSCAHRPTRGRRRRIRRDRRRRGAHDWSGSVLRERLGA